MHQTYMMYLEHVTQEVARDSWLVPKCMHISPAALRSQQDASQVPLRD